MKNEKIEKKINEINKKLIKKKKLENNNNTKEQNNIKKIQKEKVQQNKEIKNNNKIKEPMGKKLYNTIIDLKNKERNTIETVGSIGSSTLENLNNITQQTNITNLMVVNNINYNTNISLENTKRTYSNDNNSIENNNLVGKNKISQNKPKKNNNYINIIENNLINSNGVKLNNYLKNYKYKFNKNSKKKNRPNKIKKNIKDIRYIKKYINSENIRSEREEASFNLYKYLIKETNKKKFHKSLLFNKIGDKKSYFTFRLKTNFSNIMDNINRLKIGKQLGISAPKSNSKNKNKKLFINTINNPKIINKIENKKYYHVQIKKKNYLTSNNNIKNNANKTNDSISNFNFKYNKNINVSSIKNSKSKKIFRKSSNSSLMIKDHYNYITKKNKKYKYINNNNKNNNNTNNKVNQNSMELDLNQIITQTEPNIKNNNNNNSKVDLKMNSMPKKIMSEINSSIYIINKKLNYNNNKKNIFNTFKQPIYYQNVRASLISPKKYESLNKRLFKNNNISKKRQFIKIRNTDIINNYEQSLISSSSNSKTQKIFIKKNQSKKSHTKDNSFNKYLERNSKSIENNNNLSYKNVKNEKYYNKNKNINNLKSKNLLKNVNKNNTNSKIINNINIIETPDRSQSQSKSHSKNKKRDIKIKKYKKKNNTNCYSSIEEPINKKKNCKNIYLTENISNIQEKEKELKNNNIFNNEKQTIFKNNKYQSNSLNLLNNIKKRHIKFNSMKINDIYKNNIKCSKNKIVYLIDQISCNKKKNNIKELGNFNKKNTISNPSLIKKHVTFITHYHKNMKKNRMSNTKENNSMINQVKSFKKIKNNISNKNKCFKINKISKE